MSRARGKETAPGVVSADLERNQGKTFPVRVVSANGAGTNSLHCWAVLTQRMGAGEKAAWMGGKWGPAGVRYAAVNSGRLSVRQLCHRGGLEVL